MFNHLIISDDLSFGDTPPTTTEGNGVEIAKKVALILIPVEDVNNPPCYCIQVGKKISIIQRGHLE